MARGAKPVGTPVAAAQSIADVRERQAQREASAANALPAFLRALKHLDNGGDGYVITSAAVLTVPHGLGRPHVGVIFTREAKEAGSPVVKEMRSDHASFDAAKAATHIQLISNSVNEVTIKLAVF